MPPPDPSPPAADFTPSAGNGGLPKLVLVAAGGARAEIYLHGAHVTSWFPAGETADRLFVSATSNFTEKAAIRGGVPVCFPQFAAQGTLPMHGFARVSRWDLVHAHRTDAGAARAVLRLSDSEATRALWPHAFVAEMCVTVAGRSLDLLLSVENAGQDAFAFTGALHTYLRVADVRQAAVRGLCGVRYHDKLRKCDDIETAAELRITTALDRVYHAAPDDLALWEPQRTMAIRASGFPDTVVWNPDAPGGAGIADLEPDGYARMVCVEAAASRAPVMLAPGGRWRGGQTLVAR
jgi:glucose-6-phosphate 1-epimerase